jgi:hypothetical protein
MGERSRKRNWGPVGAGRLARGSQPPHSLAESGREWLVGAVRARFPKLATVLGDRGFDSMLADYLLNEPPARRSVRESGARLADYLARVPVYPVWYAELARLDRAHGDVLHAPALVPMSRSELTLDRELRLVPAHAIVELTTDADELWHALDRGQRVSSARDLDWPRQVLVWRTTGMSVRDRALDPDEAAALRAAVRGTSVVELAAGFACENPQARVLDLVLRWIDAGVLLR